MDQLQALKELAEKVEAGGKLPDAYTARDAIGGDDELTNVAADAYNGSLYAAKALHKAVLPGWGWQHGSLIVTGRPNAFLYRPAPDDADWIVHWATADTPARAWLLAILRAKINELENV
jgi:hypothetical protein